MNYSKEEFNSIWKDTSKENILNQFYYEHIELQHMLQRIDKATNYYYKTLSEYEKENKQMPEESVMMFNLMEGNK